MVLNTILGTVARTQEYKSTWLPGSQIDGHSPLTKIQSKETGSSETRKEFTRISKTVSKVPKIPSGLEKENMGQRSVGICTWAVKVRSSLSWGQYSRAIADSGQSLLLEGVRDALPARSFA